VKKLAAMLGLSAVGLFGLALVVFSGLNSNLNPWTTTSASSGQKDSPMPCGGTSLDSSPPASATIAAALIVLPIVGQARSCGPSL
jgi:hypothetical protein